MKPFSPVLVESATLGDLERVVPVYTDILLATVDVILERFERNGAYPFIDTKIDIFTGRDLTRKVGDTDIFGKETVYAWIQSRGVEALCGHARWIEALPEMPQERMQTCQAAIRSAVERVIHALESARKTNGGSLFFWMDVKGQPFKLEPDGRKTTLKLDPALCMGSDMFHVKAVAAAADFLDDNALREEASRYFARWIHAVKNGTVRGDQQPFDPKNPVGPTPGRRSHGLRMITLGSLALYARLFDNPAHVADGLDFIRYILDKHVNLNGRFPELAPYDFVEFIDPEGAPYRQNGHIVCDPGHALEFIGLGFKFLNTVRTRSDLTPAQQNEIETCDRIFPILLRHVFAQGFNPKGGICKAYALDLNRPLNADMPWWNLPETMRAALSCHNVATDAETRTACLDIARQCSNAFLSNYVNPAVRLMAYQTLDENARPIPVIPATPDLDPGYHTGLSIIDFMDALEHGKEMG